MKKISTLCLAVLSTYTGVQAGSFQLPTQGVRQTALGGSGTAFPWDASSIFFNPGSLARLSYFEVSIQGYLLRPEVRYAAPSPGSYIADNQTRFSTPFNLYVGGKFRPEHKLAFGLGVYTPFGSSLIWDDDWRGRFVTRDISLSTVFFQPTVSYEINDMISVGAGFVYGIGNMELNKAIPLQDANGEGNAYLEGRARGIGLNVGIQIQPTDRFSIGLNYRSGPVMKVNKGVAKFDVPASLAPDFPNTNFNTELHLPDMITLGVAGKVTSRLTLQADIIYATWSKYENLQFDFEQNTGSLTDTDDPRNYQNTFAIRAGANYRINEVLDVMAGINYDPTPTQDNYLTPDAVDGNRMGLSAGLSFSPTSRFNIAAAVSYVWVSPRDASYEPAQFAGTYQIKSLSPSLSFSYRFNR